MAVISRYAEKWPPTEQVLADEFVDWFGAKSFMTPTAMRELCLAKGISLSFVPLPPGLHGVNCSFQDKKEIVISEMNWFLSLMSTLFFTNSEKCWNVSLPN
jgi:hypothetical protein